MVLQSPNLILTEAFENEEHSYGVTFVTRSLDVFSAFLAYKYVKKGKFR